MPRICPLATAHKVCTRDQSQDAKTLGLTASPDLLSIADEMIE